ncbi:MAG: hypothetical protein HRT71_12980 [Flavobacteriales bacterium]|nr:hypothetical protein [Flavobacteriales bacterium]
MKNRLIIAGFLFVGLAGFTMVLNTQDKPEIVSSETVTSESGGVEVTVNNSTDVKNAIKDWKMKRN